MKELYDDAKLEIVYFESEDVITASDPDCPYKTADVTCPLDGIL